MFLRTLRNLQYRSYGFNYECRGCGSTVFISTTEEQRRALEIGFYPRHVLSSGFEHLERRKCVKCYKLELKTNNSQQGNENV